MNDAAKPVVPSGNKDVIDALTYPLYHKLARFIPRSVTPNQITVLGFVVSILGSLALIFYDSRSSLIICALCQMFYSVCDGMDGIHARRTGQCTVVGGFLDHFLDGVATMFLMYAAGLYFHLLVPLYVLIFFIRLNTSAGAFITQVETGILELPPMGPSFELFSYVVALLGHYFFPAQLDLASMVSSPAVSNFLIANNLAEAGIMKIYLLLYLIACPLSWICYFKAVGAYTRRDD